MGSIDVLIVGAGVTGLACARAMAGRGLTTVIVERHARPGTEISTHNSGVIHGGIYYPTGTLKARLCVEGRALLYEFCASRNIPHRRCGKLIVATEDSETAELLRLRAQGLANGVDTLIEVDSVFVRKREPAVHAVAALFSPDTGILDAEALVRTLLRQAEELGAIFLPATTISGAAAAAAGVEVRTEHETIVARQVVNAAGLFADEVSALLGGEAFTIYPVRGEYAELAPARRSLVNGLVYPIPHEHGLGVHLTKTVDGAVWLGPTARYQHRKDDYEGDRLPLNTFLAPARRLLGDITIDDLRLSGSGIRPKLHPATETFADFLIRRDRKNPAVVQAAGIESPGLTSCLAIGNLVAQIVAEAS